MTIRQGIQKMAAVACLALLMAGCGTLTGAAIGAGSGAAIGAGVGHPGQGALIGTGVGAAAGALYDATHAYPSYPRNSYYRGAPRRW